MNEIDLAFTPALQQAQLIRNGEVSPLELVEIYLRRIERLNPRLGSYFTVSADFAIAIAKEKTEELTKQLTKKSTNGEDLPPFFGVPISIKDLNPVEGLPCSYGNRALISNIAGHDCGVVINIKKAGFIILGKTATSELGSFPYTEPKGFNPTRNPWNLEYTAGGSSGGAASALAAGLCPIAQGSDGGGSIRIPAACCGLVGLKPSRGRVSNAPAGDYRSGTTINGPIARTVADAAAMLDAISGYIPGDPYWLPNPESSFLSAVEQKLGNLKIAFGTNFPPLGESDANYRNSVLKVVKLLEELGHTVEEKCPDFSSLIEPFTIVWQAGVGSSGIPSQLLQPLNQWLQEQTVSAGQYLKAVTQMQIAARQIVTFFNQIDILVLPVYLHTPIKVGEWASLSPEETLKKIMHWIAPCPAVNATGQPAITIPVGFDSNGLPMAVQLIGKPADEATLISLAAQLESLNPWIGYRPELDSM